MKSFLEVWLEEADRILNRELATAVTLRPGATASATENVWILRTAVSGAWRGEFLVGVNRESLTRLFAEVRLVEAGADEDMVVSVWADILHQVAEAATARCADSGEEVHSVVAAEGAALKGSAVMFHLYAAGVDVELWLADEVRKQVSDLPTEGKSSTTFGRNISREGTAVMPGNGMELLLDVELEASLRFGSREMTLNELMHLGPGDVVQLDRHVADAVDLVVGDRIVARGEVVLVNGNFGLRVSEVAEPRKQLESIRCLF